MGGASVWTEAPTVLEATVCDEAVDDTGRAVTPIAEVVIGESAGAWMGSMVASRRDLDSAKKAK